jgi:hypothetical protein
MREDTKFDKKTINDELKKKNQKLKMEIHYGMGPPTEQEYPPINPEWTLKELEVINRNIITKMEERSQKYNRAIRRETRKEVEREYIAEKIKHLEKSLEDRNLGDEMIKELKGEIERFKRLTPKESKKKEDNIKEEKEEKPKEYFNPIKSKDARMNVIQMRQELHYAREDVIKAQNNEESDERINYLKEIVEKYDVLLERSKADEKRVNSLPRKPIKPKAEEIYTKEEIQKDVRQTVKEITHLEHRMEESNVSDKKKKELKEKIKGLEHTLTVLKSLRPIDEKPKKKVSIELQMCSIRRDIDTLKSNYSRARGKERIDIKRDIKQKEKDLEGKEVEEAESIFLEKANNDPTKAESLKKQYLYFSDEELKEWSNQDPLSRSALILKKHKTKS